MTSLQTDTLDVVSTVSRLISQLGLTGLVGVIADISEEKSDSFALSGETQKAAQSKREARILQRAADQLRS
jgi:hypothetical protein